MQHDTSPHDVTIGGQRRRVQCASVVLCYSRHLYAQVYPTYNRFLAKAFLTQAFTRFGGAARRCVVDNTSVVVAAGTGANARIAPEMEAFAARFGFDFVAHAVGHANRSARVERPFAYIERNFYPGRRFADLADLNAQAIPWCCTYNTTFHSSFGGIPDELGVSEALASKALPAWVPEPQRRPLRV